MRCNAGSFLRLFSLVSVLLLNTGQARAQEVWGYSDVYYDPNYDWISAIAVTMPDYSTQYYYTAKGRHIAGGDGRIRRRLDVRRIPSVVRHGRMGVGGAGGNADARCELHRCCAAPHGDLLAVRGF